MKNILIVDKSKNYWWILFLSGVLFLIFGVWFLTAPLNSFKALTIGFGIVVLLSGLFELLFSLSNKNSIQGYQIFLWSGALNLFIGILLVANPKTILVIISILISFWLIFKGVIILKNALELKRLNNDTWRRQLLYSVIILLVAMLLIWHPEIIGITIGFWIALAFLGMGIYRILVSLQLKKGYLVK